MALNIIQITQFTLHPDGTFTSQFDVTREDGSVEGGVGINGDLAAFLAPLQGAIDLETMLRFALTYVKARSDDMSNRQLITGRPFNIDFANANPIRRN